MAKNDTEFHICFNGQYAINCEGRSSGSKEHMSSILYKYIYGERNEQFYL